jgi:hypothetical protein
MAEVKFLRVEDFPSLEVKAQMHGDRRVAVHLRFMATTRTGAFNHCRYDPGLVLEEHGHASDHALYILRGSVNIGGTECVEGTLVLLEHGATFGPLVVGPTGAELLEFHAGDMRPVPADPQRFTSMLEARGIVEVTPTFNADSPPAAPN